MDHFNATLLKNGAFLLQDFYTKTIILAAGKCTKQRPSANGSLHRYFHWKAVQSVK